MSDYIIIAVEGELTREETNNLFEARTIIENFKKSGKTVYVAFDDIVDGDNFLERIRRIYR